VKATICIFVFLLVIAPSQARTPAPPDPNSIQGLINDANDGDVIILEPRTYIGPGNYDIDFLGKAITLRSIDPNDPATVASTIIDCNHLGRAFHFHTAEDPNSILDGLTIINGYFSRGGAVYCDQTSPAISRCVFRNNYIGGAIYYSQSNATITQCVFRDNSATRDYAGAVGLSQSSLTITDCDFYHNLASKYGGGLYARHDSELILKNCTFAGNSVPDSADSDGSIGGALCTAISSITITNCLFLGNSAV